MLKALSRSDVGVESVLEVDLLPERDVCGGVEDAVAVKLSKGPSLLCCVDAAGAVSVRNISESRGALNTLQHTCTDDQDNRDEFGTTRTRLKAGQYQRLGSQHQAWLAGCPGEPTDRESPAGRAEFKVKDSSDNQTVPLGDSVILPCQVDKSLLQKSLKVEWRRTDSETLVHLYEDGESRPKKQHKKYHQRAHFITDEIKDGNFSIRLEKVRAEDAGEYACKVYSDQDCVHSADAGVEILRFDVKCSRHTLAPLGCSVVLPCYGDMPSTTEGLRVEWRKKDLEHLVHLYEDGESRAEAQQEDYQDRAHFFTDQIQHGNFSLRLDNLRTEDEGQYTCTVYSQQRSVFSAETNLEMKLLDTVFRLQMFLVFCPNLIMFLAFVLWGVSEGSLYETIFCCSLYFLRPLMLLWTAPYVNEFTGNIKTWLMYDSYLAEYILFSAALYSVMFKSAWDKSLNYTVIEGAIVIVLFVFAILFNLICITYCVWDMMASKYLSTIETHYASEG
ncbi:butyrophilin 2 [Labeo rohita]|uniref:Butyrophilin 2 n=1 Tax=Labeo rohita TaxID=84645 RepID=A0A498LZ41_LABRO|nr:butyrophilin 2 [Labeo rohita]